MMGKGLSWEMFSRQCKSNGVCGAVVPQLPPVSVSVMSEGSAWFCSCRSLRGIAAGAARV